MHSFAPFFKLNFLFCQKIAFFKVIVLKIFGYQLRSGVQPAALRDLNLSRQEKADRIEEQLEQNRAQAPLLRRLTTLEACGVEEPPETPSPRPRPVYRRLSSKDISALSAEGAELCFF